MKYNAVLQLNAKDSVALRTRAVERTYFWSVRWQQGEQLASQSIRTGKTKAVTSEKLDKYLESL